jgi:predicted oxidoreductase
MRNPTETGGIHPGISAPGYTSPFLRNPHMTSWSWLDLARDDRRYYAEAQDFEETHFKQRVYGRWQDTPTANVLPVHMLFDEWTRGADCLVARGLAWTPIVDGYTWSPDNTAEIELGWITRADSIRELATKIGRDPEAVDAAVERYNRFARAGEDADFGRDPARMRPLETPPFYAVEIVAGLICTTGGAKRDEHGRVLDHGGRPIPRLYEAGELGSFHSNLYQNGSFLTEAMLSGRWAGANAVRERAWSEELTWQA